MLSIRMFGTVLLAVWCAGCAAGPPPGRVIYETGETGKAETFVRVDPVEGQPPSDHPATISVERMSAILSSVMVKRHSGLLSMVFSNSPRPAFTPEEVAQLAPPLSKALAEAKPDESAVFYLNAPRGGEQARITSGGFSARDGRVFMTLANYQYLITWGDQAAGSLRASAQLVRQNPLYAATDGDYQLVAGPGQQLLGEASSLMGRLVSRPSRTLVVSLSTEARAAKDNDGSSNPPAAPPAAAIVPPAAVVAPPAVSASPPPPTQPAPAAPSTLEDKLRLLKKLHDDGLISDQDYEAKKLELLKSF